MFMINPLPWMEIYHFQFGTAAAVEEGGVHVISSPAAMERSGIAAGSAHYYLSHGYM